ncbi:Prenylated Rab acceptor 1 [Sporothrix epigloea]|uniref:Prenylated Rab acceptor 1 n=1 Tax=Sporothrix epigloea TaxID=1892477 RepID=A0ABP0E0H0_9PEZI
MRQDRWSPAAGGGVQRVVEELESSSGSGGSSTDARHLRQYGLAAGGGSRGAGSSEVGPLQSRRGFAGRDTDEEGSDDQDSASDPSDDSEDDVSEPGEEERAVLDSAMMRLRRAQAVGKAHVKLSKIELAALKRQNERETRAMDRQRRKERPNRRIAVPIEHLAAISRSLRTLPASSSTLSDDDRAPQRVPGSFHLDDRHGYPPVGYFPPPTTSPRALPSSSSQPILGSERSGQEYVREGSPFVYSRHVSETATTANNVNPFQYLTADSQSSPYSAGAKAATQRGAASPADLSAYARSSVASARSRGYGGSARQQAESSDEDGDKTASADEDEDEEETYGRQRPPVHNTRSHAKQMSDASQARHRSGIVVESESESASEPEPEPEPEPKRVSERSRSSKNKKSSSSTSLSANHKRKSTGASSSAASTPHTTRQRKRK